MTFPWDPPWSTEVRNSVASPLIRYKQRPKRSQAWTSNIHSFLLDLVRYCKYDSVWHYPSSLFSLEDDSTLTLATLYYFSWIIHKNAPQKSPAISKAISASVLPMPRSRPTSTAPSCRDRARRRHQRGETPRPWAVNRDCHSYTVLIFSCVWLVQ